MRIGDKYILGTALSALALGATAFGIKYAVVRHRAMPAGATMNQPPQARYEGAMTGMVATGATLALGAGLLAAMGV